MNDKSALVNETPWGYWVSFQGTVLAGLVRANYRPVDVEFVTPEDFGLQVAVMSRKANHTIPAHEHLPVNRELIGTQEVLVIRQGQLRADLFVARKYLGSLMVSAGDTLILHSGGHGFKISEDCLFIEVKQGPYAPGGDKVVFESPIKEDKSVRFLL